MVRVDPTVDAQLIKAAQNPDDGNIRIHSQTYSMYQMSLLAEQLLLSILFLSRSVHSKLFTSPFLHMPGLEERISPEPTRTCLLQLLEGSVI